ncbi:peptide/nickel transport system ATP-binding protein [Friedmanniella luteola]|uniref:Peptide/nickel transport system ATP-binding protein n=1 Tax=Friedmanniella luteola TaxID=546871 RepID=A0A1H1M054_9ACTN|nr:ABC transporter ATP-binding protein [Friedmanniella luteola]SDR80183.1 peptide/nickel transport system ATP-binding protein [Friedmanniella luteola]
MSPEPVPPLPEPVPPLPEPVEGPPALAWRDVRISYAPRLGDTEPVVAVDGVSLAVPRGGTVGIAGESGCGKSTLALSALRLLPRSARLEGSVEIGGEDLVTMRWGRLRAVRWTEAAIVFQGAMHSLNPVRPVGKQIAEALELHRTGAAADDAATTARVAELLALVDLPAGRARSYPHELSGGQKQRVMIAMALACDPDVIVADEPTTALDVVVQAQVLDVLSGLVRDRGLTLVMISHDLAVLAAVCERIVVMRHGRVVEEGPARQVVTDPQHEHTRELAAAFPVIGDPASRLQVGTRAGSRPVSPSNRPSTGSGSERAGSGGEGAGSGGEGPGSGGEGAGAAPLLEVDDLVVDFSARGTRVRAVDHVSLSCGAGEVVALVGQSGSGKTTLARTILGLQPATAGDVRYAGSPLPRDRAGLKAYRRQVQFVLQDPSASLNPKHSVYEAVAEGIRIHRLPGDEEQRVRAALTQAELLPPERYLRAIPQELSGGQRQRVVIAGALALEPGFLVADEPVASLDASVRGEILALLLRLKRDLGLGALVITHDLGLAWNIADRVLVMHRGQIVESGPVEQVLLDPQHAYTRSLLAVVPSELGRR